jgi:hypothetical protein
MALPKLRSELPDIVLGLSLHKPRKLLTGRRSSALSISARPSNPQQEYVCADVPTAFQLVVDNPDLTSLKAGFDHIQTALVDLPGPPPAPSQYGLSATPRWGRFSWALASESPARLNRIR